MALAQPYRQIVRNRVLAAAGAGVVIGPGLDIPLLIAIWTEGTLRLCDAAGVDLDRKGAQKIATALLTGGANWMVSGLALDMLTAAVPGVNVGVNSAVNAFYTYRYLRAVALLISTQDGVGSVILDSGVSIILASLSSLAPHALVRDAWEVKELLA